jgi:hyperosmotically inducible protein
MIRYFALAALSCAALAGCVRETGGELRSVAPRSDAAEPAARAADPAAAASASRTGSRLLPPPEALTDAVITARVKANIFADPSMRGADISVNTTHGVVNLTGLVASQEQSAIASAHAQREDGVMRVDNHLAVNLQ